MNSPDNCRELDRWISIYDALESKNHTQDLEQIEKDLAQCMSKDVSTTAVQVSFQMPARDDIQLFMLQGGDSVGDWSLLRGNTFYVYYSIDSCPYLKQAEEMLTAGNKRFLKKRISFDTLEGIPFPFHKDRLDHERVVHHLTSPQIFHGPNFVRGGASGLKTYLAKECSIEWFVYGWNGCGYCAKVKKMFETANVPMKYIEIYDDAGTPQNKTIDPVHKKCVGESKPVAKRIEQSDAVPIIFHKAEEIDFNELEQRLAWILKQKNMSTFESIAKNYRQWYLEDHPNASAFAYSMLDPSVLVPLVETMYTRLVRNRQRYVKLDDMEWGRDQSLYKWLVHYFDTTDVQNPDGRSLMSGVPHPLSSIEEAVRHFLNQFNSYAAQDTMLIREKQRLDLLQVMNGEDNDCYWSYTGPGGGQYLHSIQNKSVGPDGVAQDKTEQEYLFTRNLVQNPASYHGTRFRKQEQLSISKNGLPSSIQF